MSEQIIIEGDCLEVMRGFADKQFDLVLTDPPYGMEKDFANDGPEEADKLCRAAMDECRRVARGNILSFWSAQRMQRIIDNFGIYKRIMIWDKDWAIFTPNNVGYRFEPIVWVAGEKANKMRGDIFKHFPIIRKVQEESAGHPTQKPVELMREIIADFSNEGDTILDPFMGSGTTLVAAKYLNRNATGIEISPKYCEVARNRLAQQQLF